MPIFITDINLAILVYYALLSIWYTCTLISAFPDMINTYKEISLGNLDWLMQHSLVPITIIIPAYNEGTRILNCLHSIFKNDYKSTYVVIVNDGSTDNTLDILKSELELYEVPPVIQQVIPSQPIRHYYLSRKFPKISVIDKVHGPQNNGADSNNAGLNAAATPLVMTLDADTIINSDSITHMIYTFLSQRNCIAVGGSIYVLNGNTIKDGQVTSALLPKARIPAFQSLEYYRSFTYGRAGLNNFSGALCFPGAFTLLEKRAALEFGGYDADNFSYDAEITLKFHHLMRRKRYPTKVRFSSNAMSWTNVPHNLKSFWEQRNRWQRGMLLSAWKHRAMFFNPRYKVVGLLTFPAFILFEIFSPVIEFISYFLILISYYYHALYFTDLMWFIGLAWSFLTALTCVGFYINLLTFKTYNKASDIIRIIWLITLEMFGFRQFKAACCFYSTMQFFINRLRGKAL